MTTEMPEQTFAERLRLAMDARGLNANQLAIKAGVAPAYFSTAFKRNTKAVTMEQARKIAPALGVRAVWLMSGEPPMTGPGDEPLALETREPTPMTPPAKSDTRRIATHYEDPQVEGYFASAIRHAPEEPTGKQIVTSKVFLREKMTKMVEGVDMVEFALGVIEAVQVLDKAGQLGEPEDPATHTVILAYLTAQSRARRTPREVALADARKRQLLEESANPEDDPPSAEPVKVAPRKSKGGR